MINGGDAQCASIDQLNGEGNERAGSNELSNIVDHIGS